MSKALQWEGIKAQTMTGSSLVRDVEAQDIDVVVLVDDLYHAVNEMSKLGAVQTSYDYGAGENSEFFTMREGKYNLIVMSNEEFFQKWAAATYMLQRFQLKEKADRVLLFSVVVDGRLTEAEAALFGYKHKEELSL